MTALMHAEDERARINVGLDSARRVRLGQFMTPAPVAELMASARLPQLSHLRILDPGAGVGSLSAAIADRIASSVHLPDKVEFTAFEVEALMIEGLTATLKACAEVLQAVGVECETRIYQRDFLEYVTLENEQEFDVAILNPPYKKLSSRSTIHGRLASAGLASPNLYSSFVAGALSLLSAGGSAIAITPRSFCNGSYFSRFRRYLHQNSAIRWLHIYETRNHAFAGDDVLQENIIMHLVKDAKADQILISSSDGRSSDIRKRVVPAPQVVNPNDPDSFIRVPDAEHADRVLEEFRRFSTSLDDLGLTVSTGRVVDFRALEYLLKDAQPGAVPLVYPSHFARGQISWPIPEFRKYNAIRVCARTMKLINPAGNYTLVRRFSAKEERRRVVATVYDGSLHPDHIAFENHINYFHAAGRPLRADTARGLSVFLNSTLVDDFVRQFNGHTQVNAGDLRSLCYPTEAQLRRLGAQWVPGMSQDHIDTLLAHLGPFPIL